MALFRTLATVRRSSGHRSRLCAVLRRAIVRRKLPSSSSARVVRIGGEVEAHNTAAASPIPQRFDLVYGVLQISFIF